jgi:hypothetical protein
VPLPTFLVIGAMKCGTSSLWGYLRDHPQVFMPSLKEPNFFIAQKGWKLGLDWYRSLFEEAGDAVAIGEASPGYTKAHHNPGVPQRIAEVLPNVRLIYLVRDPIERMISHYLHQRAAGVETRPAEQAFVESPTYIDTSRYAFQLQHHLACVDRDHILLVTSESLRDRRAATLARIHAFIGVHPAVMPDGLDVLRHQSEQKQMRALAFERFRRTAVHRAARRLTPPAARHLLGRLVIRRARADDVRISEALRRNLVERLRPEVQALRPYMDEDFDGWGIA